MGREVGGGFRWGTHVNPWLIHVTVRQKPLQKPLVISLQLIKINEKKVASIAKEQVKKMQMPEIVSLVLEIIN